MEWLIANRAAEELQSGQPSAVLGSCECSSLMAKFLIELAGQDRVLAWVRATAEDGQAPAPAKKNVPTLLDRLTKAVGETAETPRSRISGRPSDSDCCSRYNLVAEGEDLRGRDFSGQALIGAKLRRADLTGAA